MITSKENKTFKKLKKLLTKKYRDEFSEFIVFGEHLIQMAQKNDTLVEIYTINKELEGTFIELNLAKELNQTKTLFERFALCKASSKEILSDKILILDDIQDPQNLGALIRSASAFGFNQVIVSKNSCDIYNDKAIRASQGSLFDVDYMRTDIVKKIMDLKKDGYSVLYADAHESSEVKSSYQKLAIVLGNEGNGISEKVKKVCDLPIHLKTSNVESLNVSIAGSILMYLYKGE